jgi:N-acyl-D-aspartate/D-glutamate deacylase
MKPCPIRIRAALARARSLRLARKHGLDMAQLIAGLSSNTAVYLRNMGLKAMQERGLLQETMVADITIFDPLKISYQATYKNGLAESTGIVHILVNGKFALSDGAIVAAATNGQALRFETK